jgi:hypothetical protein
VIDPCDGIGQKVAKAAKEIHRACFAFFAIVCSEMRRHCRETIDVPEPCYSGHELLFFKHRLTD